MAQPSVQALKGLQTGRRSCHGTNNERTRKPNTDINMKVQQQTRINGTINTVNAKFL